MAPAKLTTNPDPERIVKRVEGVPVRTRHYAEADKLLSGTDPKKAALLRNAMAAICAAEPGWGDKDKKPSALSLEEAA